MHWWGSSEVESRRKGLPAALFQLFLLFVLFFVTCQPSAAIPAFARKYGMPCSACHLAWPMLSPFGQQFKDNGYQMGNERDAPIFQQAAYWPITFRITPVWHRESTDKNQVDGAAGPGANEAKITTHGFDWSGLDFHTGGTLAKNFSFYVLPSSDNTGAFHFESVWARMDNLLGSSWLNVKMGKFELDNLLSEKRILTLTNVSGVYTNYHFQPFVAPGVVENYTFGIGDNQVGLEWMGHSKDDRTRVSAALLSSNDGSPGLPTSRGYDAFFAASRAFEIGSLGLQRVGAFAYLGQAPTYFQNNLTSTTVVGTDSVTGAPITSTTTAGYPGTGVGNKGFQRYGLLGQWYIKKFDITTIYFHSTDNAYLGTNTPAYSPLPAGAHSPTWNGGLFESHYTFNPQLILINRYELVRMSQQSFDTNPSNLGNADVLTFGFRYYPFINARAGFAYHGEYAIIWQKGASPVTFTNQTTSSLLFGFDFDF
jgi:hypothetical protein